VVSAKQAAVVSAPVVPPPVVVPEPVIAAKQTAVETVTAAASTSASSSAAAAGKAPTLLEYITRNGSRAITSELESVSKFDAAANVQDKLGIMKQNAINLIGANKLPNVDTKATLNAISENTKALSASAAASTATVKGAATKMTAVVAGTAAASAGGVSMPDASSVATFDVGSTLNVNDLVDALKVKEYGSWYVAVAAIVYATVQRQAGKEDARLEFVQELEKAEAKAMEAEEAALLAAQGAIEAKRLADTIMKDQTSAESSALEGSRLRQIEVDQDLMRAELTRLATENSNLLSQLAEATAAPKEKELKVAKAAAAAPAVKKAPPVITVMERDQDEDERFLELIKQVDEENKATATKKKAAAEKPQTKAKSKAKAQTSKAKSKSKATDKKKEEVVAEKKSEPKKSKVKGADRVAAAVEELAPKATKKSAKKSASKKSSAKKSAKKAKKAAAAAAAAEEEPFFASPAAGIDNPWSSLSDSTLKRKTIAQLSEYLTERGAQVVDQNGKALPKALLVGNLRSL